jgi:hypothetical protein
MAAISLVTAGKAEVVESIMQRTLPCAVAVTAGNAVYIDSNGKWALADADSTAASRTVHIATRSAAAGAACTAISIGIMDGFDLSALAYGDPVYVSATAGGLDTAPGTVDSAVVGYVTPGWAQPLGTAADKLLQVYSLPSATQWS